MNLTPETIPERQGECLIPFAAAAALMLLLCLWGGFFGFIGEHPLTLFGFIPAGGLPAGRFILLFAMTWASCIAMLLLWPRGLSKRNAFSLLLLISLAARVFLLPHEPSDDINRYLFEGRQISAGINPYIASPASVSGTPMAAMDPYHGAINHPDLPAAYPPLVLLIFSLVGGLWYHPLAIKFCMILFDTGTLLLLLDLLARRNLPLQRAVLYAFNPVVLYSFAGQAHFDAIHNFLLVAAICLYDRRAFGRMFLLLGMAIQIKYIAIIAVPFFIRRDNVQKLPICIAASIVFYLPFLEGGVAPLFYAIGKFGNQYAFNGSLHALLRYLFGGIAEATAVTRGLFLFALAFGYRFFHPGVPRFKDDPLPGCFFAMGALVLLSPTVHFWYLAWVAPFVVICLSPAWILLFLTIGCYFITVGIYHYTGVWHLPWWAHLLEWTPFWLLFSGSLLRGLLRFFEPYQPLPPDTLSVIIPVINETDRLGACIEALSGSRHLIEVIVVDGGSTDDSTAIAKRLGARVLSHVKAPEAGGGRGGQIHAGVMAATGDVVAIVHADTKVDAHSLDRMMGCLARNPWVVGGALGSFFGASGWRFRLLEAANNFRVLVSGISFGDQVQFFRREPVVSRDLFPDIPLIEDVELSLRLGRLGGQLLLWEDAEVSARTWKKKGFSHSLLVIRLLTAYLAARLWKQPDTLSMYRLYYGKNNKAKSDTPPAPSSAASR